MKSLLLGEVRPLSIENSNTFYFIEGNEKVVSAVWLISQVSILCVLYSVKGRVPESYNRHRITKTFNLSL